MKRSTALSATRLLTGWGTVAAFLVLGGSWLGAMRSPVLAAVQFAWLLGVIGWCAFGVVDQADHLAELLGEPLGTLVLTLSIVTIEVALMAAVMLGTEQPVLLGLEPANMVLLAVTLALSMLTFSGSPTTVLEGAVHLVLFFVYIVLIFSP